MTGQSVEELARTLDHSLLKPNLSLSELEAGSREAIGLGVASVCIVPHFLPQLVELAAGTRTLPSTILDFPHGALSLDAKLEELEVALAAGAKEVDAVVNIGLVVSERFETVERQIGELCSRCHAAGAKFKLIFETCYLSKRQKIELCRISARAGVDWVKTSTGFGPHGATPDDVRLLRDQSPPHVQVKASGKIRDLDAVLEYLALGATRIGTSQSAAILAEAERRWHDR